MKIVYVIGWSGVLLMASMTPLFSFCFTLDDHPVEWRLFYGFALIGGVGDLICGSVLLRKKQWFGILFFLIGLLWVLFNVFAVET